jgi:5'-3' exonuclease
MGVKGLFRFLKQFEKSVHIPQYISNKSVGIDIFWFIHQSKGDIFIFQKNILPILNNAIEVHCVFDGAPSEEKKQILEENARKRQETYKSIDQIEQFMRYPFNRLSKEDRYYIYQYVNQLKRQIWQPSPEYINQIKQWLYTKGCIIHQAIYEADDLLFNLEKDRIISIIITNDSDLFILGASKVLRPYSPVSGGMFVKDSICRKIKFTEDQWANFMYLCKFMKNPDILLAYSYISVYKDLDYVCQKYDNIHRKCLV